MTKWSVLDSYSIAEDGRRIWSIVLRHNIIEDELGLVQYHQGTRRAYGGME
jgi:hypothetical protein